jgi:cytochrome c5
LDAKFRDIKVAPDSSLWVLTEHGTIYRLSRETTPVQSSLEIGQRDGESIYLTVCSNCHDQNVPGAPQISNISDWTSRLQKDRKKLYRNTIDGYNNMPERGLCDDCTNAEVKRAVDFIIRRLKR